MSRNQIMIHTSISYQCYMQFEASRFRDQEVIILQTTSIEQLTLIQSRII